MRSDLCGALRRNDVGRTVELCGWVARRREHGEHLAFVDLRDHSGIVQCVVDNTIDVRSEYVVRIIGVVRERPAGTVNPNLPTGEVEVGECTRGGAAGGDPSALPDRCQGRRCRRGRTPAAPLPRHPPRADAAQPPPAVRRQLGRAAGDGGAGLRRGRDADARALHPRGRSRVPRPVAPRARFVLRPAAVAAAVQAAADGRRHRSLLPDRPLPARRGPAGRPAVRVHATRCRDELRRSGRRAGSHQCIGAGRRRVGDW